MPDIKPVNFLADEITVPPWSEKAELKASTPIRQLQKGHSLSMPISRPMPSIGKRCHELRIKDNKATWRVIYRTDPDAIVVPEVFKKKSNKTPKHIIDICKDRLARYDIAQKEK